MISKQDIINTALLSFGDRAPSPVTDDILDSQYTINEQLLLSMEYWNFSQVVTTLGLVSDTFELYNYKYKYNLPTNMANLYSIYYQTLQDRYYRVLGNFLYSNYNPLQCQYTNAESLEAYPVHFANCLSYLLATKLCVAYGSANSQPSLVQLYQGALREARLINGKDIPSVNYHMNYYSSVRQSGTGFSGGGWW